MKRELTFENYITMCDRYQESEFQCGDWWPSVIDIKTKLEPKIEQNLEFLIWVSETANEPKTPQQKESRDYINKLLNKTLVFIEEKKTKTTNNDIVEDNKEDIDDKNDVNEETEYKTEK